MNILFVCLGNICRSPAAEGVFVHLAKERGVEHQFHVDSAGIIDFHQGKPADARMREHALRRSITLDSRSRPVRTPEDFEKFDLIVAMDRRNMQDLYELDGEQKYRDKIALMSQFFSSSNLEEVPDPYYGGPEGFEQVLDLVTEGSQGILEKYI